MKFPPLLHFRPWNKRYLSLRLRLAVALGALVLILSLGLLIFVNLRLLNSFPQKTKDAFPQSLSHGPVSDNTSLSQKEPPPDPVPLTTALLFDLQITSLIGYGVVAILGGASAYWLAGIVLSPVRRVNEAARQISARTLNTRIAMEGPNDEVKELADTFDTMLGRLERTFEQQSRFIGDVAHELRTPLASLRLNLEVVTSDENASIADYRNMAATQERALTRLEHLVADLLLLARNEQPPVRDEVTLEPLIEEALHDLQHAARQRQVHLQLITKNEVVVHGDASLLTRAFSNLIENAINYNRPDGEVIITVDSKDNWAIVTIADTGIGMPAEQQALIFERFYRIDSSRLRHNGGAGLGLSIVTAIVQQHGGHMHLESAPNKGSIFTMSLPM